MKVIQTELDGVLIIEPTVYGDDRGFFLETFHTDRYREAGLDAIFVQDNHSRSSRGVLRGLHFQVKFAQGKFIQVSRGAIYDVAVDITPSSPTFGRYVGVTLDDQNHRQFYVPPHYAHGFCVLSDITDVHYKCTDYYHPEDEGGVIWNDPTVGIDWPIKVPTLSAKDQKLPTLNELVGDGST